MNLLISVLLYGLLQPVFGDMEMPPNATVVSARMMFLTEGMSPDQVEIVLGLKKTPVLVNLNQPSIHWWGDTFSIKPNHQLSLIYVYENGTKGLLHGVTLYERGNGTTKFQKSFTNGKGFQPTPAIPGKGGGFQPTPSTPGIGSGHKGVSEIPKK